MIDDIARRIASEMRSTLDGYAASADVAALDRVVGRLSDAIDALTGYVAEDWLHGLRSAWWPLEYTNGTALDGDRKQLTPGEMESVSVARDEFLALLEERSVAESAPVESNRHEARVLSSAAASATGGVNRSSGRREEATHHA